MYLESFLVRECEGELSSWAVYGCFWELLRSHLTAEKLAISKTRRDPAAVS